MLSSDLYETREEAQIKNEKMEIEAKLSLRQDIIKQELEIWHLDLESCLDKIRENNGDSEYNKHLNMVARAKEQILKIFVGFKRYITAELSDYSLEKYSKVVSFIDEVIPEKITQLMSSGFLTIVKNNVPRSDRLLDFSCQEIRDAILTEVEIIKNKAIDKKSKELEEKYNCDSVKMARLNEFKTKLTDENFDSSLSSDVQKEKYKLRAKNFGIVLYAEPEFYNSELSKLSSLPDGILKHIHINVDKNVVLEELKAFLGATYNIFCEKVVVGHEHGSNNGKCHFQCCVFGQKEVHKTFSPFVLLIPVENSIMPIKLLGMFQKVRNPHAIINYCKKENDFAIWETEVKTRKKNDSIENCFYHDIEKFMEGDGAEFVKSMMTVGGRITRDALFMGKHIEENFNKYLKSKPLPEFNWIYPTVFSEEKHQNKHYKIAIDEWLKFECYPIQDRRKALFLYSERGFGKTEFAKRLVPDEAYYIYCRASLDGRQFKEKEKTAKLVILDDITYSPRDIELWKALLSGQETNINTKYCNEHFKHGLPTIVLTNDYNTFLEWTSHDMFKNQCYFVTIDEMIIPADITEHLKFHKQHLFINDRQREDVNEFLRKKTERKDEKSENLTVDQIKKTALKLLFLVDKK